MYCKKLPKNYFKHHNIIFIILASCIIFIEFHVIHNIFCFTDCIKYKPASPSANLYPDLSLIADDDHDIKPLMTPLEIQSMACKVVVLFLFI